MYLIFLHFVDDAGAEEGMEVLRLERRALRDNSNPFEMPEAHFRKHYRLSRELTRTLIEQLTPHMNAGVRRTKVTIAGRILGALRFFAQGSYQRSVGNERDVALAQQTMSKALTIVCEAIETIAPLWIKFPTAPEEKERKKNDFMRAFQFPGVIGCIDGTHVAICQTKEDEHLYFNRKGYHSKNVQITCDSDLLILNVFCKFWGLYT